VTSPVPRIQAQRAVRGALPYATAKAAVEGLTRALAPDYGPRGIRVNAVALGCLLSPDASFINGAILPVDGGRAALGLDPEEA
jgi:enoyl-[acyl-carrier-protein] reductase (NADH)